MFFFYHREREIMGMAQPMSSRAMILRKQCYRYSVLLTVLIALQKGFGIAAGHLAGLAYSC